MKNKKYNISPWYNYFYHKDFASVIIDLVDIELNRFVSYFISKEAAVLPDFRGIYFPLK